MQLSTLGRHASDGPRSDSRMLALIPASSPGIRIRGRLQPRNQRSGGDASVNPIRRRRSWTLLDGRVNLVVAALQLPAVIDVGLADAEGCGSIWNIFSVADTEAIAGCDGRAERDQTRVGTTTMELRQL